MVTRYLPFGAELGNAVCDVISDAQLALGQQQPYGGVYDRLGR